MLSAAQNEVDQSERFHSERFHSERFLGLQYLRGIAALMVAFSHVLHETKIFSGDNVFQSNYNFFPWMSGVDLFFVISGFVMVYSSRNLFEERGSWHIFLRKRIARIVPLYWLATTLLIMMFFVLPSSLNFIPNTQQVIASYAFFPMIGQDENIQPIFKLGWTLNYEMFFYMLFACILAFHWRVGLLVLACVMALLVITGHFFSLNDALTFWTRPILLEFLGGVGIGYLWLCGVKISRAAQFVLFACGIMALLLNGAHAPSRNGWEVLILLGMPCMLIVAASVLGQGATDESSQGIISRWGVYLGDASYALYLFHPFALKGLNLFLQKTHLNNALSQDFFILLGLSCSIILAIIIYRFVEKPCVVFARRLLRV